jgi:hypothetical protein
MSQVDENANLDDSMEFGEYQMAATQLIPDSDCWGCREGHLNQLAHIDYGGCLYFEDDDVTDSETIIETQSHTGTVDDSQIEEAREDEINQDS